MSDCINEFKILNQLPRNVRQIGDSLSMSRIYIEDYAYTYLKQYTHRYREEKQVMLLVGDKCDYKGQRIVLIKGTIKLEEVTREDNALVLTEESILKSYKIASEYFDSIHIVGIVYSKPGEGTLFNDIGDNIISTYFKDEYSIILIKDPIEEEEQIYQYTNDQFKAVTGYFVYYEKNTSMHNYMLANKVQKQKVEQVPVEQAIERYRQTKSHDDNYFNESKRFISMLSVISGILIVLCGLLCYGLINNIDEISTLKLAFNNVSEKYTVIENEYMVLKENQDKQQKNIAEENNINTKEKLAKTNGKNDEKKNKTEETTRKEVEKTVETQKTQEVIAANAPKKYVVVKGDSLIGICHMFYDNEEKVNEIKELNNIYDENIIYIGQEIVLP